MNEPAARLTAPAALDLLRLAIGGINLLRDNVETLPSGIVVAYGRVTTWALALNKTPEIINNPSARAAILSDIEHALEVVTDGNFAALRTYRPSRVTAALQVATA